MGRLIETELVIEIRGNFKWSYEQKTRKKSNNYLHFPTRFGDGLLFLALLQIAVSTF